MITTRLLNADDGKVLETSIAGDSYHAASTTPAFFADSRCESTAFEIDSKPIMYVRAAKALRLDVQFCDNNDKKNNAVALHELESIVERAKASGFVELIFCTTAPLLRAYCMKYFKFESVEGELRRYL